ncbi:phage tail tube protein [Sphingobium sp. AN558]|uniref:phage tail tube protein n=1 Tax=Sphingobium sp. AN558 TaxID=3133442 RepID=UPI0030BE6CCE
MSFPTEADFALIKIKTADGPPAVFAQLCGIESVTINRSANMSERYRRDCAKPGRPGQRKLRATGNSWQISGSGVQNIDMEATYSGALGVLKDYEVELYRDDDTDAGELLGTYAGTAMMTTQNQTSDQNAEGSTLEITLEGQDNLIWTAA